MLSCFNVDVILVSLTRAYYYYEFEVGLKDESKNESGAKGACLYVKRSNSALYLYSF